MKKDSKAYKQINLPFGLNIGIEISHHRKGKFLYRDIYIDEDLVAQSRVPASGKHFEEVDESHWWLSYLHGETPVSDQGKGEVSVLELFCGPGGLAQGLKQFCLETGFRFKSLGAVDLDAEAVSVYAKNHDSEASLLRKGKEDCKHKEEACCEGNTNALVDYVINGAGSKAQWAARPQIIDSQWESYFKEEGTPNVLLAGPPCQGHSNLNNHTRRNDVRNLAYLDVPAIAIALDIPVVIIENVSAVVHDKYKVVDTTKNLLEKEGYVVESGVLRADKLGWPQTRSRFFMVARKGSRPIPFSDISSALKREQPLDLWWAIADLENVEPTEHHMYRQSERTKENTKRINWLHRHGLNDLPDRMRPECHRDKPHTYPSVYGRLYADRPAPTITSGFMTLGRGRFMHPTQPRMLNPREAARIQGFPDTYIWQAGEGEPKTTHLLKWIGDAVPMPLGYAAAFSALGPKLLEQK